MRTVVCFRKASTWYCMPVESTRAVRPADGLVELPDPRAGVVGIVAEDPPLTVISPLGSGGDHILVVEAAGRRFGLLVDEVTGLRRIDELAVGNAPDGQARPLVSGAIHTGDRLLLVADAEALAGQL